MHKISVVFGPVGTMFVFLFKTEEKAKEALGDGPIDVKFRVTDDYGQSGEFSTSGIHCVMLEDLEQSAGAQIEMGLHNARTQVKANQIAQQDPKLKTAAMLNGGNLIHPGPMPRQ